MIDSINDSTNGSIDDSINDMNFEILKAVLYGKLSFNSAIQVFVTIGTLFFPSLPF